MLKLCKKINDQVKLNTNLSDLYTETMYVGRNRQELVDLSSIDMKALTKSKRPGPEKVKWVICNLCKALVGRPSEFYSHMKRKHWNEDRKF